MSPPASILQSWMTIGRLAAKSMLSAADNFTFKVDDPAWGAAGAWLAAGLVTASPSLSAMAISVFSWQMRLILWRLPCLRLPARTPKRHFDVSKPNSLDSKGVRGFSCSACGGL